jgi:O-acetyl-ADP-ribose deacetylase (regulator of RNase III)
MLKAFRGDLFASPAQTLVNTVNCVGVMGKGVALEFIEPVMFDKLRDLPIAVEIYAPHA